MSEISKSISESKLKPAFIPFIVSGFPDFETTKELLHVFEKSGAAAVELGIPFSDPMADGPVIQAASKFAIENGVNLEKIFEMLEEVKASVRVPLILFSYYNPVLFYGCEKFINKAKSCNIKGLIIPDLPVEESAEFSKLCKQASIDLINLIAPTSSPERIENIAKQSEGFIYLVSSTGVTGVRESFSSVLGGLLKKIKNTVKTPVAIGFGVSKKEHIKEIIDLGADAAIVGSAIVKIINLHKDNKKAVLEKITDYIKELYG